MPVALLYLHSLNNAAYLTTAALQSYLSWTHTHIHTHKLHSQKHQLKACLVPLKSKHPSAWDGFLSQLFSAGVALDWHQHTAQIQPHASLCCMDCQQQGEWDGTTVIKRGKISKEVLNCWMIIENKHQMLSSLLICIAIASLVPCKD